MIKLEIPNDPRMLAAASDFFAVLAGDVSNVCAATEADPTPVAATADAPAEPAEQHVETPTVNAGGIEVDAEGLPWDERIHSSNRKKSANGKWMKRRGVQPLVWDEVRTELFGRMVAEAPAAQPVAEAPAAQPVAEAPAAQPVAEAPAAQPVAEAPAAPLTFPDLLKEVTGMLNAGRLNQEQLNEVVTANGFEQLGLASTASSDILQNLLFGITAVASPVQGA